MRYLYEPTPEAIVDVRDELQPYIHDPAGYWQYLADRLIVGALELVQAHRAECQLDECRTCIEAARLLIPVDAHDAIQPTGCACDEHLVYPRLPSGATKP